MAEASRRLRLGIAGTGFIGAVHRACAARSTSVELVAVASARGRADAANCPGLDSSVRLLTLDELHASDEVDAVLVCTRTSDHARHAVAVLAAGKHLLLEKPGAINLADHAVIADAAATRPELTVRVAYHRRHDARFRDLARLVTTGAIGEPFCVQMTSREDFPPSPADEYAGGFIMDVGVHDFDTARWLLNSDAQSVHTRTQAVIYRDADLDNAYVTVTHGDALASTHLSRTSRVGLDLRCEVLGSEGSILLTDAPLTRGITILTREHTHAFPADCRQRFGDAYLTQLDDFAAACRGADTSNATLADDRAAVATAVAARASAASRRSLTIGPDYAWSHADTDAARQHRHGQSPGQ